VDEAEALKTLEILEGMGVMAPELMTFGPGMDAPAIVIDDAPGALNLHPEMPAPGTGRPPA
jgi:hypothetical protein